MFIDNHVVLVTGGTGSFGKAFIKRLFTDYKPQKVIVFSRDEYKQSIMAEDFPSTTYPIRFFVGDVRDKDRLYRAFDGVDIVIHCAALKQVPSCEYNPFEAIKTNIMGSSNVVEAAIDRGVKKVIALSTDKAVTPINLYGATKLALERLFVAANAYAGGKNTLFSVVRYGNVVGSRGSVIPIFYEIYRKHQKIYPITHPEMTRFWLTLPTAVDLVITALESPIHGGIFVPKIPSMKVIDLARVFNPQAEFDIIGIRPGEKLHEMLISDYEGARTIWDPALKLYIILPTSFDVSEYQSSMVPPGFAYTSDKNTQWLDLDSMKKVIFAHAETNSV